MASMPALHERLLPLACISAVATALACGPAWSAEPIGTVPATKAAKEAKAGPEANAGDDGPTEPEPRAKTDAQPNYDVKADDGADWHWVPVATEFSAFRVKGTQTVRFGAGDRWIVKQIKGGANCNRNTFGGNPAPWIKQCELKVDGPVPALQRPGEKPMPAPTPPKALARPVTAMTADAENARPGTADDPMLHAGPAGASAGPEVDPKLAWVGSAGFSDRRVKATEEKPANSKTGAFRVVCDPSHLGYDDPIVYPGQPGKAHLHTFFGNTLTNANSTPQSIAKEGNSTCRGGIVDRTAYWVPTMIDTETGRPLRPIQSIFYYKNGYYDIDPATIQPVPEGLRMVAGNAGNDRAQGPFSYRCIGKAATARRSGKVIPDCDVGSTLQMGVDFPECWDGKNLDSPDHQSHMAYRRGKTCPASHPVPIPRISTEVRYAVTTPDIAKRWRLSSDTYSADKPGGMSAHADFFDGWEPEVMRSIVENCNRAHKDCHAHLIGDGKRIY